MPPKTYAIREADDGESNPLTDHFLVFRPDELAPGQAYLGDGWFIPTLTWLSAPAPTSCHLTGDPRCRGLDAREPPMALVSEAGQDLGSITRQSWASVQMPRRWMLRAARTGAEPEESWLNLAPADSDSPPSVRYGRAEFRAIPNPAVLRVGVQPDGVSESGGGAVELGVGEAVAVTSRHLPPGPRGSTSRALLASGHRP